MTSREALDELEWFINCVYDSVEDGHAPYLKDEVELASNAYNKLEKDLEVLEEYKSIEEAFRIDLRILFKALKNGFYHYDDNGIVHTSSNESYISLQAHSCLPNQMCIEIDYGDYSTMYFYFEDYGKTWALTREELENEKRKNI